MLIDEEDRELGTGRARRARLRPAASRVLGVRLQPGGRAAAAAPRARQVPLARAVDELGLRPPAPRRDDGGRRGPPLPRGARHRRRRPARRSGPCATAPSWPTSSRTSSTTCSSCEVSVDPSPDPEEVVEWRFVPVPELDEWIAPRPRDRVHGMVPAGVGDRRRYRSVVVSERDRPRVGAGAECVESADRLAKVIGTMALATGPVQDVCAGSTRSG